MRKKKSIKPYEPSIGSGIYSIPEVSALLNLSPAKVRRWLNDFWSTRLADKNSSYSWGEGREKAVNFYTLIEFYVFYQLRVRGVTAKRILESHKALANRLKTPFPFASSKLLTDGKQIIVEFGEDLATADQKTQLFFREVIEPFCSKIEFDKAHLAQRFYPLGKSRKIVVDPAHRFGQPVIEGTNIDPEILYSLNHGGESVERLMSLYKLNEKQIKDAIEFGEKFAA